MKIKVCGLTRADDAKLAADLGAWALGFIFAPQSPRCVTPEAAAKLVSILPPSSLKVGVFVNQTKDILQIAHHTHLTAIQLHGDEDPTVCRLLREHLRRPIIKAFQSKSPADLKSILRYKGAIDFALIDAAVDGAYGGTGQRSDWELARMIKAMGFEIILSGGLSPDTIADAARDVPQAFAYDLCSSVEESPGHKAPEKLRALFEKAG